MGNQRPGHNDIRIAFTLGGQAFEAVGFIKWGEKWVWGQEALRRVDNGYLVHSDTDWTVVCNHRRELPTELQGYWLMTASSVPAFEDRVSGFRYEDLQWNHHWYRVNGLWFRTELVLRHRM